MNLGAVELKVHKNKCGSGFSLLVVLEGVSCRLPGVSDGLGGWNKAKIWGLEGEDPWDPQEMEQVIGNTVTGILLQIWK